MGKKTNTALLASGAGVGLLSGSGGTTLHACAPDDDSMYCKFSRFTNIVQMIIFLLAVVVVLFFIVKYIIK